MTHLHKYTFTIPIGDRDIYSSHSALYYSPLTGESLFSPIRESAKVHSRLRRISSVNDLRKMSILPNHRCNFECSYCYAAQGRNFSELDKEIVDTALHFSINHHRTCFLPTGMMNHRWMKHTDSIADSYADNLF